MKIITIGRETNNDIVIDDPKISRRHAVLRIHPFGKTEIVDYSMNGTSINGVKIAKEVPTRVKRSDSVSFAGIKNLDWERIPRYGRRNMFITAGICGLAMIAAMVLILIGVNRGEKTQDNSSEDSGYIYSSGSGEPVQSADKEEYTPIPQGSKAPAGLIKEQKKAAKPAPSGAGKKAEDINKKQERPVEEKPAKTPAVKEKGSKGSGFSDSKRKGV